MSLPHGPSQSGSGDPDIGVSVGRSNVMTAKQASVLAHTSETGRYCTDDPEVIAMGEVGLLRDFGPQEIAGGMHYLWMTDKGRKALEEWRAAQPKPPKPKRRQSRQFKAWRSFCDGYKRMPFGQFVKEVWPHRRDYV
jgi:hypothetical protein